MTMVEMIWSIVASLGMVAGFMLEWRRGHLSDRVKALEEANNPTNSALHARVYELEQWHDRVRRGV